MEGPRLDGHVGDVVSESKAIETLGGRSIDPDALNHTLTWSLFLIFAVGAPSLIVTRYLYWLTRPEVFLTTTPSISGTASEPPSSEFFFWAASVIVVLLFVAWTLNAMMNAGRLSAAVPRPSRINGPAILNLLASLVGYAAAIFLFLLAFYPLRSGHDMHISASWGFYICTALSITLDTGGTAWLQRSYPDAVTPVERLGLKLRALIAVLVVLFSFFFLYLYLARDYALPTDKYTLQVIYVVTEYIVIFLFFAYPMTGFAEMRRHYREIAPNIRIA